jgi:hypothetical protein
MTIQERFDDIVAVVDNPTCGQIRDVELRKMLLDPMKGTHLQREQQAQKRLFRGYACTYNSLVSGA